MSAARTPRNSNLTSSNRRSSTRRDPMYQSFLDRARRPRRIPISMIAEYSSSESSPVSVESEDPEENQPANIDENLPRSSTSAEAATGQINNEESPLASTSRHVSGVIRRANSDEESVNNVGQSETENMEIPNAEQAEGSSNALVVPSTSRSQELQANPNASTADVIVITPSPPKKRKRIGSETPKNKNTPKLGKNGSNSEDDDGDDLDDGCTCPICFDSWEMSGEHRLVSLRCGHLFGESCIRRWLSECGRQSGAKMCPQCKSKVVLRDIRYLYAKRVRAIDRTEEHELRKSLEHDRKKLKNVEIELDTLKITYAVTLRKVQEQDLEIERLKNSIRTRPSGPYLDEVSGILSSKVYKLFMEKNITLSQDSGCRVMGYTKKLSSLLVSQKSSNSLFPGFGVRVIDVPSFRINQFIHMTSQSLRDIAISADEQIMACTSMEPCVKLHDFRMRSTVQVTAPNSDKKLWACAMGGINRENYLYAGGQRGSTFVFDTRFTSSVLGEYETIGDLSPVISIVEIPKCDDFPNGGFCSCKLQSIWFYEFQGEEFVPTRLNIEGPFTSMIYEESLSLLIVTARITNPDPESRYLIGKLIKIQFRPHFELTATLLGAKCAPVITRSCHISINSNSLLTSYIQDSKQLAVFDIRRKVRIQSLPVYDVIYDTCTIYTSQDIYVAALTESKCRIYKLNES